MAFKIFSHANLLTRWNLCWYEKQMKKHLPPKLIIYPHHFMKCFFSMI